MGKLICGKNSVLDAIKNNIPVKVLYVVKKPVLHIKGDFEVKILNKAQMDKMANSNHQGYIAELKEFNYYSLNELITDQPQKILVLDRIQDPHNFGAILRSANAFGIEHVIIAKERQVDVTPAVMKVSSGGCVGIKIIRVDSMTSTIQKLKKEQFWIYATAIEGGVPLSKASFNAPMAIVLGNEGKGVSKPILKLSDQNVFIPMKGTVQSLNVSVAAGIILSKI